MLPLMAVNWPVIAVCTALIELFSALTALIVGSPVGKTVNVAHTVGTTEPFANAPQS